jgi:hypothetical protein
MDKLLESYDALLTEKDRLLDVRIKLMDEALLESTNQLKTYERQIDWLEDALTCEEETVAELDAVLLSSEETVAKLQAKLEEANRVAEEAIARAMNASKQWKKEKDRRKKAERKLQEIQSILTPQEEPVQEPLEPQVEPEPVQEPQVEPHSPTANEVLAVYQNFLGRVNVQPFWTIQLLRNHATHLGIETYGKGKERLLSEIRQAIRDNVQLQDPLILIGHFEQRLEETQCAFVDKSSLHIHCQYYSIDTTGKKKDELARMLYQRL